MLQRYASTNKRLETYKYFNCSELALYHLFLSNNTFYNLQDTRHSTIYKTPDILQSTRHQTFYNLQDTKHSTIYKTPNILQSTRHQTFYNLQDTRHSTIYKTPDILQSTRHQTFYNLQDTRHSTIYKTPNIPQSTRHHTFHNLGDTQHFLKQRLGIEERGTADFEFVYFRAVDVLSFDICLYLSPRIRRLGTVSKWMKRSVMSECHLRHDCDSYLSQRVELVTCFD
ncbi:hypothetical protein BgiBS90_015767 [Biomphalaria glabrata]|nr:hypothetical protein BgiBS90_015767 [Biomphalaria glabrata]